MGIQVIIASDSHAGALDFADRLCRTIGVHYEGSVKVINGGKLFDDFIREGYGELAGGNEAAKAYLKLQEQFPYGSLINPTRESLLRQVKFAERTQVLIITEVRDAKTIQALEGLTDRQTILYFMEASPRLREEEFYRRFPGAERADIRSHLTDFVGDMEDGHTFINIDTKADFMMKGLGVARDVLLIAPPPQGPLGGSLGDDIKEVGI